MNVHSPDACSLSILAGPPDAPFVRETVRHLARVQNHAFVDRALVIDTLPPAPGRSTAGTPELIAAAEQLKSEGEVDRVIRLDAACAARRASDVRHFGRAVKWDRDFRGIPLRGWTAGLDASNAPYHVHYDCDILLHQADGYSWVAAGVELLRTVPELLTVAPHPGPPGAALLQSDPFDTDPRGFHRFATFSSRRFVIDRGRYAAALPLSPRAASRRHRLRSLFGGGSPVLNWELMVEAMMRERRLYRGHLTDPRAWALHAPDHGPRFCALLPAVIARVDRGDYPRAQAGRYDLDLAAWA